MNGHTSAKPSSEGVRASALPYLIVGLACYVVLLAAAAVRTIEPIFLWVAAHSLVVERVHAGGTRVAAHAILLTAYVVASFIAWLIVERPGLARTRVWKRASLSWLVIQLTFCLVVFALVELGVLYE